MASTTARRHRMRCSRGAGGCGRRFTLRQDPALYERAPGCPSCGSHRVHSVEAARAREIAAQERCRCGSYPFVHRQGSLRLCVHHPRFDEPLTREEQADYERCIGTPRSLCA